MFDLEKDQACGGWNVIGYFSGCASVFYGYCSPYYFLHKYNTKLYNRVKEMGLETTNIKQQTI